MSDLGTFREETRAWLEENCPKAMRTPMVKGEECIGGRNPYFAHPETKVWLTRMGEKGWTAPTWPKEYGGGGLSKDEVRILSEELGRIGARSPLFSFGLWMIGPVLLEFGSEEQKAEHLPKIVRGEIVWCQGYSEPGAGSDLAGLQTSATEDSDDFILNGQKVWTSFADKADWMYALVRTRSDKKHGGITMIMFDMESPGVSTRPIKLISGQSPFCEVFLDQVRVPKTNVVGEINAGWQISNKLLQFERENISSGVFAAKQTRDPSDIAKKYLGELNSTIDDPVARLKLSELKMRERALQLTVARVQEETKAGSSTGSISSIFKFIAAELNKDRYEYLVEVMGMNALGWKGEAFDQVELETAREWLRSKANSIEGGTTEINLNVIAKRVLGLQSH